MLHCRELKYKHICIYINSVYVNDSGVYIHFHKYTPIKRKIDAGDRDQFLAQKIGTAQFYCTQLLPRNHAHLEAIVCDAKFLDELSFEQT